MSLPSPAPSASPATVSRAGIIFVSESDLDWRPVLDAWLNDRPEAQAGMLRAFFDKMDTLTEYAKIRRNLDKAET